MTTEVNQREMKFKFDEERLEKENKALGEKVNSFEKGLGKN